MGTLFSKMICIVFSLFVLISLTSITFGANENIVMGPYGIAFDLNTTLNHTIEVQPPIVSENGTNYRAYIRFTNETQILVGVDESRTPRDSTLETEERFVSALALQDRNATVTVRTVDNKQGILTTSLSESGMPTFTFSYWLNSNKCDCGDVWAGRTKLEMVGIVPMDITESLLNTLHVTNVTGMPAQVQPSVPVSGGIQSVGGAQGAAIAKELQPQPPLKPSPSTTSIPPGLSSSLAGNVGPDDPAYYYLYHWSRGDMTTNQILENISQSSIRY